MEKKISVVIATCKRPALLKNCLEALSKQEFDFDDFEIVIVSDGPDKATRTLMHSLDRISLPFVQYITLTERSGPAAARNAGWKKATGELIAFTDDDCIPESNWLSSLWAAFIQHGSPKFIAFTGRVVVPVPEVPTDYEKNTAHLEKADFVTANCACTRKALMRIHGFDEQFKTAWREDSDLEFRLMDQMIPIYKVASARVIHPVRKAPWGVSMKEQKKTMFNALLYKKYPTLFRSKIQPSPAWHYYFTIAGFLVMLYGLIMHQHVVLLTGGIVYAGLTIILILRRLYRTSKRFRHVLEMIATSIAIPFLSVYWTIYGSFKYGVLYY